MLSHDTKTYAKHFLNWDWLHYSTTKEKALHFCHKPTKPLGRIPVFMLQCLSKNLVLPIVSNFQLIIKSCPGYNAEASQYPTKEYFVTPETLGHKISHQEVCWGL